MPHVTRLAPSPTGALHLGNARTFVINWALARCQSWRIVLRIEDLDTPRTKSWAVAQALADLRWLGLDWDDPAPPLTANPATHTASTADSHDPSPAPPYYTQRADLSPYQAALDRLYAQGLIYPCTCSRSQIENAQSAPHGDEHELRYPGTCRPAGQGPAAHPATFPAIPPAAPPPQLGIASDAAWRLRVPDVDVTYVDRIHGPQACNVQAQVGDFVVVSKSGLPAYQLAVVVDDARQGVTDIVRGDDLLSSAARQVLLYRALGLTPLPTYWHLPLVLGPDGRRLAKRHGDTRLSRYRDLGVPAERIMGLLARWSGITDERQPMTRDEFRDRFDPARLPRTPVTMTPDDHAWLLQR